MKTLFWFKSIIFLKVIFKSMLAIPSSIKMVKESLNHDIQMSSLVEVSA